MGNTRLIYHHLKKYVKGQDESLRDIAVALDLHEKRINGIGTQKENILISGPSGCGKTETIRAIHALGLPCPILEINAMMYTPTSWRGADMESMFDIRATLDYAIVVIDEFDKVLQIPGFSRDYQSSLLKLMEGHTFLRPTDEEVINTENMLFVLVGAFNGLLDHIGFGQKLTADRGDYISYGIMPELMGRTPVCCHYKPMTTDMLMDIMLNSKKSVYNEWRLRFNAIGCKMSITNEVLHSLAQRALDERIGARGLTAVFAEKLYPIYYYSRKGDEITIES